MPVVTQAERLQRMWLIGVSGLAAVTLGLSFYAVQVWVGRPLAVTGTVLVILILGNAFHVATAPLSLLVRVLGEPGVEAWFGLQTVVANVMATVPLAIWLGPVGVAIGTCVGQALSSLSYVFSVRRRLGIRIRHFVREVPWPAFAVTVLLSVLLGALLFGIGGRGPAWLPAYAGSGIVACAVFVGLARRDIRGAKGGAPPATAAPVQ
jgi:O-antigen/teichoic acid export membrane protein